MLSFLQIAIVMKLVTHVNMVTLVFQVQNQMMNSSTTVATAQKVL
jgi:hypothetical protein